MEEGQLLDDHLSGVAALAERFAAKFGAGAQGRLLGLTHDLGKAAPAFQTYLAEAHAGGHPKKSPHANPGALAAGDWLQSLAIVVQAHHAGLPSVDGARTRLNEADDTAATAAYELALTMDLETLDQPFGDDPLQQEHGLRMLLSALVDADRLDTEAFPPHLAPERSAGRPIAWYRDRLRERMAGFPTDDRPVTRIRREVGAACVAAAGGPIGFRFLTVPTGGGKTLASLLYALEHAALHGLDRVIVAIPYTSIIQQTAAIFRGIFGEENVLEHHSGVAVREREEDGEGFSPADQRARLATENWDVPLVVTTNVQLFESLLGDHPRRVRKLHNVARAVIVLDEVQTLPPELLEASLDALGWMVDRARTSVLFCTATMPDYSAIRKIPTALREAQEIVAEPERHFEDLKRVEFVYAGTLDHAEVAAWLGEREQGLVIVNSRRDSMRIFEALADPDALYLSTFLVPAHRAVQIAEIKRRLEAKEPCRVVSTQVVEAGVDVDFPFVMRAMAPLDSIVQAAGRCNREGRLDGLGLCEVFDLEGGASPPGTYDAMISTTRRYVPARIGELGMPGLQREYTRVLLGEGGNVATDKRVKLANGERGLQDLRRDQDYPEVAKAAQLIAEETTAVVVRGYSPEADAEIDRVLAAMARGMSPRLGLRRLAPYTVSLFERDARKASDAGRIGADEATGVLLWRGVYDRRLGIGGGDVIRDPGDLMA